MSLRESNYEIEFRIDEISVLEEKILFSNICDFIIPMNYVILENKRKVTYNCNGYISLKDLQLKKPYEIFLVLEKIFLSLNRTSEYYILPEKITLDLELIYYNLENQDIRFAYVPKENGNIIKNINKMIEDLMDVAFEDAKEYLFSVKEELYLYNKNLKALATFICEQRQRMEQCGII